jgi:hypothetical protein
MDLVGLGLALGRSLVSYSALVATLLAAEEAEFLDQTPNAENCNISEWLDCSWES